MRNNHYYFIITNGKGKVYDGVYASLKDARENLKNIAKEGEEKMDEMIEFFPIPDCMETTTVVVGLRMKTIKDE